jgi:hypothetical protein
LHLHNTSNKKKPRKFETCKSKIKEYKNLQEHEQQLFQAAAPVNLINPPPVHRLTHEPYHDTHELHHHDEHDIDTPGVPAAATGKKIVFKSSGICI